MRTIKDISYSNTDNPMHKLDVYLPDCDSFPVVVYFHGGGIETGNKKCRFCPYLQKKGVAVVSANYRMYPEAKFPEFIEDAAESVSWAVKNMHKYGTVTGIYVGGSSAGGYLSQMLCFDGKYLSKYGVDADSITGYIFDAGQPTVHFNVLRERGVDSRKVVVDDAAPLYHVCSERNYPPMKIIVSDNDLPGRYEQTLLLNATLKNLGHESKLHYKLMENSSHCSYTDAVDENGENPLTEMIYDFIKNTL